MPTLPTMTALTLGMAFRCMDPPRHIFIPLFDPQKPGDEMLLVNLTTLRDSCVDDACVLHPSDYAELTHATTVAYSMAMTGKKSSLISAGASGHFVQLNSIPTPTLAKVIAGAHASPELSKIKKSLLPP